MKKFFKNRKTVFNYFFIFIILYLSIFYSQCKKEVIPKDLRISMGLDVDEWKIIRGEVIPLFEKKYNIKVYSVDVTPQEIEGLLRGAKKNSEEAPLDVFSQDNMLLVSLVQNDLVEDLSNYEEMLAPELINALVEACKINGKLYFAPYRPNVQIMYYNKSKFEEYGLSPPTTWDQWLYVARQFKKKEGSGKILLKGYSAYGGLDVTVSQMYEYIVSAGGDPFSFNDEGFVKTFKYFQELWKYSAQDSKDAKWDTSNEYMGREVCYLMQNWSFGYKILYKDWGLKDNIRVYSGIKGPKREAHVIGGEVLGIPKGAKNIDMSIKFIQFMQSKEVQEILVTKLGWPAVRNDAYEKVEEWMKPQYKAINEALKYGIFRKEVPYWNKYRDLFHKAYKNIIIDQKSIKLLDNYAKEMKQIIENENQIKKEK